LQYPAGRKVEIYLSKTMNRFAEGFREEGMHQGKHQGEALVLERLRRLKFGTSPDEGTATARAGRRADPAHVA